MNIELGGIVNWLSKPSDGFEVRGQADLLEYMH